MTIALLLSLLSALGPARPGGRLFWVVRDGLTGRESVERLLSLAQNSGADGLLVQVVGRGEAYYRSEVLPAASPVGEFDPLGYLIARAKPMGMQVHAWINVFLVWSAPWEPTDSTHVYNSHPEWFTADRRGRSTRDYTRQQCEEAGIVGAMLSPAVPGVRELMADVAGELAREYEVDGIHLDYVRYPSSSFGYEPAARAGFLFERGIDPAVSPVYSDTADAAESWTSWRQEQVTETVVTIRASLDRIDPAIRLSAAVIADPYQAAGSFGCDWRSWLRKGLVDFVCPMAYTTNLQRAEDLALMAGAVRPCSVVYGVAVYNQSLASALQGGMEALRGGCGGLCLFSLNSMRESDASTLRRFWNDVSLPSRSGVPPTMMHRVWQQGRVEE
ncbi:family 10 glycosylhydrolase [Candidatus Fermentibacteria bacterium]|nr:family 10 glycosylhydrolase [Candidatus Fermentibacteria bacterium]